MVNECWATDWPKMPHLQNKEKFLLVKSYYVPIGTKYQLIPSHMKRKGVLKEDSFILRSRYNSVSEWEWDTAAAAAAAHALNFRGTKRRIGRVRAIIDSIPASPIQMCVLRVGKACAT